MPRGDVLARFVGLRLFVDVDAFSFCSAFQDYETNRRDRSPFAHIPFARNFL